MSQRTCCAIVWATSPEPSSVLRSWLARTSGSVHAATSPTETEQYVFSVVAILAQLSMSANHTRDLQSLHEVLERFCQGNVSREYAMAALDKGWGGGLASFILGDDTPDLEQNLNVALSTSTSLNELQALLDAAHRNEAIPSDSRLFLAQGGYEDELGAAFRAVLSIEPTSPGICVNAETANFGLSCCHLQFSASGSLDSVPRGLPRGPAGCEPDQSEVAT